MQLTLRQRQRVLSLLALWSLLTLLCAVTGPFGTHDVMGLGARGLLGDGRCGLYLGLSDRIADVTAFFCV